MKIHVTTTMNASPDGLRVHAYQAGETYEMPDDLGAVFLREQWGAVREPVKADEPNEPDERRKKKQAKGPSENK